MKKYLFGWMSIVLMAFLCLGFASCSKSDSDDDDNGSGSGFSSGQWYIKRTPWQVDLIRIDLDAAATFGSTMTIEELRRDVMSGVTGCVIHIINDNTLEVLYDDYFCENGASVSGKQLLYRLNTGTYLGTLAFYSSQSTLYTYESIDNKIYVPMWGKIFTVLGDALWEDGGRAYSSYNPDSEMFYI